MDMMPDKRELILIVDDQPENIHILYEAVAPLAEVVFATNGQDALAKIKSSQPDLILLDVEMPGMNGYAVCKAIKSDPLYQSIPVIFVTAHHEMENELKALEFGGIDFLHKPINTAIAQARVKTHLALRRESRHLALTRSTLHSIIHHLPSFVAYWDASFNNVFSNDNKGSWFGLTAQNMLGLSLNQVIGKESSDLLAPHIKQATEGHTATFEYNLTVADGSEISVYAALVPTLIDSQFNGVVLLLNDITELKATQNALHDEKEQLQVTLNSIGDAVIATDIEGRVSYMNPIAESLTGWYQSEVKGRPIEEVMPLTDSSMKYPLKNPIYLALEEKRIVGMALNSSLRRRDEQYFEVEDSAAPIRNKEGIVKGAIIVFHDVSEARAMALKMSHLANHDALTNLPNRMLLQDRVERAIFNAARKKEKVAMLVVDIDHFKIINDSVGHSVGDELLQSVAKRLKHYSRTIDTVSRHGGDEFIVLLPEISSAEQVAQYASRLMEVISESIWVNQQRYVLSSSIGISLFPEDSNDMEVMYRHADSAMYQAKQSGRNRWQFFSTELEAQVQERHQLEQYMHHALEHQLFEVFYQAKVDARTNAVIGLEALLRLKDRKGEFISPAVFIPFAEENGLIVPIGQMVMQQVFEHVHHWQQSGIELVVSINISVVQFKKSTFLESVRAALLQHDVKPGGIEFEITEGVLAKNSEESRAVLAELKALGLQISIDDFGTGYSSLSYLKRFPIDVLKIDQSFVRDMLTDSSDAAIVEAIINLGRSLGLELIAEGVETADQAQALLAKGCHLMQGYHYCRPMPFKAICDYIQQAKRF